jgi:hypothetical protein
MAFQSGVAAVGSTPHLALTWLVAVVLVACSLLFLGMLSVEVWRSVQFARRVHAIRKASTTSSPVGHASRPSRQFTDNPLNVRRPTCLSGSDAAVTMSSAQADPGGQPLEQAPGGSNGQRDAPARAHPGVRPPPPPPSRDGGPNGLLTTVFGTAAVTALEPRSLPASRGPLGPAASPESVVGRDGRVRRLRHATTGQQLLSTTTPPPPDPEFAAAGGRGEERRSDEVGES